MCHPLALAAAGTGQAILGHAAANQQASARNKNRKRLYDSQVNQVQIEHEFDLAQWYHGHIDAKKKWAENALAANRAAQEEQEKLNMKIATAFLDTGADYAEMFSDKRIAKSLERSGRSARRIKTAAYASLGRKKAARSAETFYTRTQMSSMLKTVAHQRKVADNRAEQMIGFTPQRGMMPVKPTWDKGPGLMSLIVNTTLGAASGYMAGKGFELGKTGNIASGPLQGWDRGDLFAGATAAQSFKMDTNNRNIGTDPWLPHDRRRNLLSRRQYRRQY